MSIQDRPSQRHARRRKGLWYRDAIIYELSVASFFDSNDDGIGDFRGLTDKLGYLQDLGVTGLSLLPFYPSPMKADGYDVAEFTSIHPDLGAPEDFQQFLMAAHRRGLRIILELVLNQTSDGHPWFERARRAGPGTRWRNFYVWSDSPVRYGEAQSAVESASWAWDPVANAYCWHHLQPQQPALNYDSADVREAMLQVVDFWLELGVDGLRLEALPYLFLREGVQSGDAPETHAFLKTLRHQIDRKFRDRILIADLNRWPSDASAYFGDGDECHMVFCVPFLGRLLAAIEAEDRFPILDVLQWVPPTSETCNWALSLRDTDDVSLVRLDDRRWMPRHAGLHKGDDVGPRTGPRRRLAPLVNNDRRQIELVNGLLFSLPGTPVLSYGDEIGMGDNVHLGERNAVRTPMQWSADRNAGFSQVDPQRLLLPVISDPEYQHAVVNVEAQAGNPHSLLSWTRDLIATRTRSRALSRGSLEFLFPKGEQVLSFVRRYRNERVLVVANLSPCVQAVELDLSGDNGATPVEMFGGDGFPPIHEGPYFLTLGPYSFYWLALKR